MSGAIAALLIIGMSAAILWHFSNIVVYGGNFDLFTNISDESIQDLETIDYNFEWSESGIDALENNTEGAVHLRAKWWNEKETDEDHKNGYQRTEQRPAYPAFHFFFFLRRLSGAALLSFLTALLDLKRFWLTKPLVRFISFCPG